MHRFELRVQEARADKGDRTKKWAKTGALLGGATGLGMATALKGGHVTHIAQGAVEGAGIGALASMIRKRKKKSKLGLKKESAVIESNIQEAKKTSVSQQINKIKGRVKGEASDFSKLSGKLAAKGAKTPGALAAFIGRKKFGAKGFAKLGKAGKAKAKAVKESRTIRALPQRDTKGVSEKLGSMASTKIGRQEFAAKLAKKASKKVRYRNKLMASLKGKI